MRSFPAVVERCPDTGLFVAHVPGFAGAHTQAASLDQLQDNLREVIALLLEEGEPTLSSELVGVTTLPFHRGRDRSPILLRLIASDVGLTPSELLEACMKRS